MGLNLIYISKRGPRYIQPAVMDHIEDDINDDDESSTTSITKK